MKIELTQVEVSEIIVRLLSENQRIYPGGAFKLEWKIDYQVGSKAEVVGVTVTLEKP